jgi:intein-encoded DNA endonuclease-like protein
MSSKKEYDRSWHYKKYHSDPLYKARCMERGRERYWKARGRRLKGLCPEERIALFNEVKRLHRSGQGYADISEQLNISRRRVKKWLNGTIPLTIPDLSPSPDLAYIAGVRLGDGSLTKSGNVYRVRLSVIDQDFASQFALSLSHILGKQINVTSYIVKKDKRRIWRVRIASKKW